MARKENAKTVKVQHSVDKMMQNVALSLIRDFRENLDEHDAFQGFESAVKTRDPLVIREATPAVDFQLEPAKFKAVYQLGSIFKRYRFSKDLYSDDELTEKAILNFQGTQDRIASIDWARLDDDTQLVLKVAARYVANVLGPYSDEEHRSLCRFGKRASVGVPARLACQAQRWELPITGSFNQISWFDSEMSQDVAVQNYWRRQQNSDLKRGVPVRSIYKEIDCLKLAIVPKTFKSVRTIMPNTTIGSYMSYGLGEMIRKRLARNGYDIRTLQERHRVLAQRASVHKLHVTADLSSASDSISVALVERLLPPDWLGILNQSRIGRVLLPNGSIVDSNTYCTMGVGYTFPLQTLVFLSLLVAIQAILYDRLDRRTISVFGDDLIYASRMHFPVLRFFEQLGFVINVDKTFYDEDFRESCGGDYFRGVDVRPFQPKNGSATVGNKTYEAILYKCINGLLMRWSEYEIASTLQYLMSELEKCCKTAKLVPKHFPDDAGIQCAWVGFWDFLQNARIAHPKSIGHGLYRFSYLRFTPEEREERRHEPYLWDALRGHVEPVFDYADTRCNRLDLLHVNSPILEELQHQISKVDTFIIREDPNLTVRSCLTGQRLPKQSTMLTISHTGRYTRQYGTSCFEDRR